jgi:FkbM family methyltransferase
MTVSKGLKTQVARALCSRPMSGVLGLDRRREIRVGGASVHVDDPVVTLATRASMFWGLYESAERRAIHGFVERPSCVVELGSSIGVTGAHLLRRMAPGGRFLAVEANAALLPLLTRNLMRHADNTDVRILHGAIDYSGAETVALEEAHSNVGGRVTGSAGTQVPAISLEALLAAHDVPDGYTLVADIEGAEAALAMHDADSLRRAGTCIIEVHAAAVGGTTLTADAVLDLLLSANHRLVARDGNVVVLRSRG